MADRALKVYQLQMAALKREIRREGFNLGIRAAIKMVRELPNSHDVHSAAVLLNLRLELDRKIKGPLKEGKYGMLGVKR
jgi:hypothetical protein